MGGSKPVYRGTYTPCFETPDWVYFDPEERKIILPDEYLVPGHDTEKPKIEHPRFRRLFDGMGAADTDEGVAAANDEWSKNQLAKIAHLSEEELNQLRELLEARERKSSPSTKRPHTAAQLASARVT